MIGLSPGYGWLATAPLSVQGKRQSHYRTAPASASSRRDIAKRRRGSLLCCRFGWVLKALPALRGHLSLSGRALAERAEVSLSVSSARSILRPPLIKPTVVVQPEFPQRFSRPRRKAMRAKTKLKPGQDGAKSLLDRYGGQSRCVRHRYGEARGLRHKTIEMTAGTVPWSQQTAEIPSATIVGRSR
jgi:hypothetical protein